MSRRRNPFEALSNTEVLLIKTKFTVALWRLSRRHKFIPATLIFWQACKGSNIKQDFCVFLHKIWIFTIFYCFLTNFWKANRKETIKNPKKFIDKRVECHFSKYHQQTGWKVSDDRPINHFLVETMKNQLVSWNGDKGNFSFNFLNFLSFFGVF